jgi:mRNA-degrading endonuclease YafQ of YafQ-DinJ toxin-antitoxin module
VLAVFQRWLIAQAQLVPSGSATMMAMRILLKRVVNDQAFPLEADRRECHIGGDFLLIYRLDGEAIVFVRAGTHSELCEE